MLTAATAAIVYWGLLIGGAGLSCLLSVCKFVDWKRHIARPARHEYGASADPVIHAATRKAPLMAGKPTERVIKFSEVAPLMKTGDGLTFSGRSFWSYLIRIASFSDKSHAGMVYRDDEGLWVIDSCEGRGVTKRLLLDEVQNHPGQWYFSEIAPEFRGKYDRDAMGKAAMSMVENNAKYGWAGIALQASIHLPILREVAYFSSLSRLAYFAVRQFCSQALTTLMRTGRLDPVPGRDPQLVMPQDIAQSLAFRGWLALIPG